MCGIAGEFRFDNTAPDAEAMSRIWPSARARPLRRGPASDGRSAGHRRLGSSPSPALGKHHDHAAAHRTGINGTHLQLSLTARQLIGAARVIPTRYEVILRAYWSGEACVDACTACSRLPSGTVRACSCTDRLGIKPAYLQTKTRHASACSTPQALLAAGASTRH